MIEVKAAAKLLLAEQEQEVEEPPAAQNFAESAEFDATPFMKSKPPLINFDQIVEEEKKELRLPDDRQAG